MYGRPLVNHTNGRKFLSPGQANGLHLAYHQGFMGVNHEPRRV
jgi:hypothetical protein